MSFATHATCPLTLTTYKYSELQVSFTTQKLSWKANCKTPIVFNNARCPTKTKEKSSPFLMYPI